MNICDRDIQYLKGVGEKRAQLYKRLSINTIGDLLHYYPRSYIDFSSAKKISETYPGEICCIRASIVEPATISMIRRGMTLYKFKAADNSSVCEIIFFNNKYITSLLKVGQSYYFFGKIGGNRFKHEMISPEFIDSSENDLLRPVYHLTAGLTSRSVASAVRLAISLLGGSADDPLSDGIRQKYGLCHISYALRNIHFPKDHKALETARRRLIFEELITLCLGMSLLRHRNSSYTAHRCVPADLTPFFNRLTFEPTGAQKRAINDGINDMTRNNPMNRLVEGDVGSGKTVVAAALCYNAAYNSLQSALMAPTEILARQHFMTLNSLLSPCGISVGLLIGSTTMTERKKILKMLKTGELDIVVGTHALISQFVEFYKLGLVITDEQHRFGVAQRAALASKGNAPHVLVMSATPIPRTLGLIIYGDLDVSILDEMPHGRQKVETFFIDGSKRRRAFNFIKKFLSNGKQAFIVCPLVEDNENEPHGLAAAVSYKERIAKEDFKDYRVGLLHGKLKSLQKENIMRAFAQGDIDILVSTTVIEVGVDVPNAVIMLVENAERFGLSQLHQLRGRVGRGNEKSYCILVSDAHSRQSAERLHTMCETTDGFEIAEKDLKLRGPGDFFGKRQHGLPELKIADLANDLNMLSLARDAADSILKSDPKLEKIENAGLMEQINSMFSKEDVAFN